MAEQIVVDYYEKLPMCIVRPSIVTAANNEPFPGWIDNVYGITGKYLLTKFGSGLTHVHHQSIGILMEIGRGTLTSVLGVEDYNVDLIPVDTVCNTLITAAWANSFTRTNSIPVYNCTSGQMNPVTWYEIGESIKTYARKSPSKYVLMYPDFFYTKSRFVHLVYEAFFHFLPAIAFDLMLRVQGKRPIMLKLAKRFKMAADVGKYFVLHEWEFQNKNVQRIIRAARETQLDAQEFNCDLTHMDWDSYIEKYMMGIRTFVLKDSIESLAKARKKLQRIIWTKRVAQVVLVFVFHFIVFSGFWK